MLTLTDREEISRGIAELLGFSDIAVWIEQFGLGVDAFGASVVVLEGDGGR
jgi:hypothetical protein